MVNLEKKVEELERRIKALEKGGSKKPRKPRKPSAWNLYYKNNFARLRKAHPNKAVGDIMKIASKEFKSKK